MRERSKKKGEPLLTPPFVHDSRMLDLELISPVQIAVQPASTLPGTAVVPNPQVSLYSRGQIARVIPQQAPTDAHPRRDEVPQIPLSDYINATMELTTIDRRKITSPGARHVSPLKVCTHQDRSRCIRRAGQETLRAPQIQIVTDQPIIPTLLAP